jgi:hypothetical protein
VTQTPEPPLGNSACRAPPHNVGSPANGQRDASG